MNQANQANQAQLEETLDLKGLLALIREQDNQQVEAQFEIARLLSAIKRYKLYKPHYDTFAMLVQCELDFAPSTADRYAALYQGFMTYRYSRAELLKLMRQLGWRRVTYCLVKNKKKMGYRAMKKFLEEEVFSQDRQFNFNMRSDQSAKKLEKALTSFGLEFDKSGRRQHLTEALEALLDDYLAQQKAPKNSKSKVA